MDNVGGTDQRLFGAIYDLAGGDPSVLVDRSAAAEKVGLNPVGNEFSVAVEALETKGYVIGQSSGHEHFRLSDTILRQQQQQQQWDDIINFDYCPNHNISYPAGTTCPGCN